MNTLPIRNALRAGRPRLRFLPFCLAMVLVAVPAPATTVRPPKFAELVNESDYIVHAVVKSVTSEWREKEGHRHIFTFVELEVLEVIAGTPPQPLVLQMLGGRVGDEEMVVDGAPRFQAGQEDVLFVRGNGRQFSPLTAVMHGRYPVLHDKDGRAFVARSNRVPLHDTAEVAQPMTDGSAAEKQQQARATAPALSPADFVQKIRSAVDVNYRKANEN